MDTLTLKDLEKLEDYENAYPSHQQWAGLDRWELIGLLSLARRQLEQEWKAAGHSSVSGACAPPVHSDVPPLGRISKSGALVFKDEDGDECMFWTDEKGFGVSSSENGIFFRKDQIPSLLAHISAWLDTGSFELKPRAVESDVSTPATDQSTDGKTDTERMDWLESQKIVKLSYFMMDPRWEIDSVQMESPLVHQTSHLRKAIDKAMAGEGGVLREYQHQHHQDRHLSHSRPAFREVLH